MRRALWISAGVPLGVMLAGVGTAVGVWRMLWHATHDWDRMVSTWEAVEEAFGFDD